MTTPLATLDLGTQHRVQQQAGTPGKDSSLRSLQTSSPVLGAVQLDATIQGAERSHGDTDEPDDDNGSGGYVAERKAAAEPHSLHRRL